jgi:hypothetical protein
LPNCANAQLSVRSNDGSLEESVTVEDLEAALEQFREIAVDWVWNTSNPRKDNCHVRQIYLR